MRPSHLFHLIIFFELWNCKCAADAPMLMPLYLYIPIFDSAFGVSVLPRPRPWAPMWICELHATVVGFCGNRIDSTKTTDREHTKHRGGLDRMFLPIPPRPPLHCLFAGAGIGTAQSLHSSQIQNDLWPLLWVIANAVELTNHKYSPIAVQRKCKYGVVCVPLLWTEQTLTWSKAFTGSASL